MTLLTIVASNAIAMPLSPAFPANELQYILDQSQASLLLTSQKMQDKTQEVVKTGLQHNPTVHTIEKLFESSANNDEVKLEDVPSEDGGMMLYTSGTTNRPVRRSAHAQALLF